MSAKKTVKIADGAEPDNEGGPNQDLKDATSPKQTTSQQDDLQLVNQRSGLN